RGIVLVRKGQLGEAIAAYREALRCQPDYAEAHCNLGHTLRQQGQFRAALDALRRGRELGCRDPKWRYRDQSAVWVKECERLLALEEGLPAILRGEAAPADAAEAIAFAQVCALKGLHADAARLYEDAFAARPQLAAIRAADHRYQAARVAALAGAGPAPEGAGRDAAERARWRRQAVAWLRAELTAWTKDLADGPPQTHATVATALPHC